MRTKIKRLWVFAMTMLVAFTSFTGSFKAYATTGLRSEVEVIVDDYMQAREKLLKNNNTKKLTECAVKGIVTDEQLHRDLLQEQEIKYKKVDYLIQTVEEGDDYIEVNLRETFEYTKNNKKLECENIHLLTIMKNERNNWIVVSDAYYEETTEFISCSYAPTEGGISTFAMVANFVPTIVSVAETQVGYTEKASNKNLDSFTANAGSANYSKYGKWYGINPGAWCAMFVSWCANESGINTSMMPKYASCNTGMTTFKNMGRFNYSSTYGGSYTPKAGDIFFTGTSKTNSSHTGIVVSVSGTTMTIIDGNHSDKVCKRTMQTTNSSLIGFVSSCTHSTVQKYNSSYHWNECSICGTQMSAKIAHTFSGSGVCKSCPAKNITQIILPASL